MKQFIAHVAIVVRDYDEAIDFYINKLNFELLDDTYQPEQVGSAAVQRRSSPDEPNKIMVAKN